MKTAIGIDIGGTGTKMGLVDLTEGSLVHPRLRQLTPRPSTPENLLSLIQNMLSEVDWMGNIGIGFPGIVKDGVCRSASNIHDSWLNLNLNEFFSEGLGSDVRVGNDADVAGLAEMQFGHHDLSDHKVVLLLTLGTGIGSALFVNGQLIPNSELGHAKWKNDILEAYSSNKAREEGELSWKRYGRRLNKSLKYLHHIISPDVIILGGGVSKQMNKYQQYLELDIPVIPASLQNAAGTIGAAYYTTLEK